MDGFDTAIGENRCFPGVLSKPARGRTSLEKIGCSNIAADAVVALLVKSGIMISCLFSTAFHAGTDGFDYHLRWFC